MDFNISSFVDGVLFSNLDIIFVDESLKNINETNNIILFLGQ